MTNPSPRIITSSTDRQMLRSFLLDLICQLAYQEGDFTLSSGLKSDYYINGKEVTLHPLGAVALARLFLEILPPDTQAVAGLTLGADPIVSAVSVVSAYGDRPIPALIVRKQAKGHGTGAYIEGMTLPAGAKVVVLEDVVTTGKSAMQAVERLREVGYQVNQVMAVVDRLQGGAEFYQSQGLAFDSLFTIENVRSHYHKNIG